MSRYAEIKARHDNDHEMMQRLLAHGHVNAQVMLHFDRAALLGLVARLSECIRELAGSPAEFDNPGVGYVVIQVDRGELGNARALLEETK